MKKVLHRSFKPAKCKTTLQMAASRLKILKNKKDTQIKQLRRELAQLLESGQTQTALIRVEHVVREEKTVAAYELVGIYCELIVVRLGVIDSQKTCPNDLKEAVTSVLYASKRLSDVAELADVVKHFSAKYGKDFVSAAVGLQQDSGVSRLLVDKLSVKAPDGPTKNKLLKEIATEHNVTWEAETLVEPAPKESTVLMSGASSSQPVSEMNTGSSRIPHSQPPDFQAPATVNVAQNFYETDGRTSSGTASTNYYHQDPTPPGERTDGREHRPPSPGFVDSSPYEAEFVDAESAARAAAESAERASFAARAAAELSSKERTRTSMQSSTESRNSSSYDTLRNEPSHRHGSSSSNVQSGGFAKEEMLRSSNRQEEDQSTTRTELSKKNVDEQSENISWKRGHSRDNSLEMKPSDSFAKVGREKQQQPSMDDINVSCSEDVQLKKQPSYFSDDDNATSSDHIDAPSIFEDKHFQRTAEDTERQNHGHDVAPAFDDHSSFFDKPQFDNEDAYGDEQEHGLGFSLLGSNSNMPSETHSWSFEGDKSLGQQPSSSTSQVLEKEKASSPLFDDCPTSPPVSLHEPEPSAKFDDYDRDSESEEDDKGILSGSVEQKPKVEAPDDLGRYFFPSDTEDQEGDSMPHEDSDAETPKGLSSGPLNDELSNENTLPLYGMSPPKEKTLSKSVNEHVQTEAAPPRSQTVPSSSIRKDLYTQKESNPDKRPSSIPPYSSSSDDETEMELRKRVSSRNQDKRTELSTRLTHPPSRVTHDDLKEGIPTRASIRSQEKRTNKTTPAAVSYFHSVSSDDEDDEREFRRGASSIQTKPSISISRRTKGQERRSSSLVTAKTEKDSHDRDSIPKPIPEAKPLAKKQESASSSSSLKTVKASHDQESPPKLAYKARPQADHERPTSSSSSIPETVKSPEQVTPAKEKASHVHPKLPDYDDIFAKLGALRR
ncbi:Regulator of Vps4 activity in the MVB pathway protein [Hirschfeldia incana]|nr:Regulator of Vps4 activity in the MVB pathway protein [Hirschfeldia incana]